MWFKNFFKKDEDPIKQWKVTYNETTIELDDEELKTFFTHIQEKKTIYYLENIEFKRDGFTKLLKGE